MSIDATPFPAIHYNISQPRREDEKPSIVEKMMELNPRSIIGESNLFFYDSSRKSIGLTDPFKRLIEFLVKIKELDNRAKPGCSLPELNAIFQQTQDQGGLMRKPGAERWDLQDNINLQENRHKLEELFFEVGFVQLKPILESISVEHCLVFGGLMGRMEKRIIATAEHLTKNLDVTGHIFLLGSNRKLGEKEIIAIKEKIKNFDLPKQAFWTHFFDDKEQATEANAFAFLWECIVPEKVKSKFENKVIKVNSTAIGYSFKEREGTRVTTEVTIKDWMSYYKAGENQAVFAVVEQPYIRLLDQLRVTVLTNAKKADWKEVIERISKTTFHFAVVNTEPPLMSVVLDEIGRHVYHLTETLKYLEKLDKTGE
ncbi:hypothetical protein PHSC3_000293 [Chlamydiales bacterium STE3]|nr:hypothetical protein PHSC3_000293 [Chlamydiales bacterium STE3]